MIKTSLYPRQQSRLLKGFTLVEILVSLGVLSILLLVTANVINQVQKTWNAAASRVSQFREARVAMEVLTRNISQATLNTYIEYAGASLELNASDDGKQGRPESLRRKSDLQFICGQASALIQGGSANVFPTHAVFFQAPLGIVQNVSYAGLDRLLCGRGYFIQNSSDDAFRPPFVEQPRVRYRLMEFSPPAEQDLIYASVNPGASDDARRVSIKAWFVAAGAEMNKGETATGYSVTRPVADNIIALVISPRWDKLSSQGLGEAELAIAPNYDFDSTALGTGNNASTQKTRHLLPPVLRVALVALDEKSADRLQTDGQLSSVVDGAVQGKFADANLMDRDLESVEAALTESRVNFRIFVTTIPMLGSKWGM